MGVVEITFTTPFTAVTGAVITASGHNTSVRDNLLHLRALLPDAGGSGLPLVSSSTTSAAFAQLGNAGLATDSVSTTQVVDHCLTAVKLHANDAPANDEVFTYDSATGFAEWQTVAQLTTTTPLAAASLASDSVTTAKILNANVTTAKIADSNVTTAKIADANVTNAKMATDSVSTTQVVDHCITVAKLDAIDAPADDEVFTYDSGTGRAEWQAISALANSVPSGLIAAFATVAAIASGWARYTAADGRMLVGAGTTFSTTYIENTDYGSAWSHTPLGSIVVAIGAPSGTEQMESGSTDTVTSKSHTHAISSQTFTGSATTWVIPSRAVVWAQKS